MKQEAGECGGRKGREKERAEKGEGWNERGNGKIRRAKKWMNQINKKGGFLTIGPRNVGFTI